MRNEHLPADERAEIATIVRRNRQALCEAWFEIGRMSGREGISKPAALRLARQQAGDAFGDDWLMSPWAPEGDSAP